MRARAAWRFGRTDAEQLCLCPPKRTRTTRCVWRRWRAGACAAAAGASETLTATSRDLSGVLVLPELKAARAVRAMRFMHHSVRPRHHGLDDGCHERVVTSVTASGYSG